MSEGLQQAMGLLVSPSPPPLISLSQQGGCPKLTQGVSEVDASMSEVDASMSEIDASMSEIDATIPKITTEITQRLPRQYEARP